LPLPTGRQSIFVVAKDLIRCPIIQHRQRSTFLPDPHQFLGQGRLPTTLLPFHYNEGGSGARAGFERLVLELVYRGFAEKRDGQQKAQDAA
jgi:hypothetical protein